MAVEASLMSAGARAPCKEMFTEPGDAPARLRAAPSGVLFGMILSDTAEYALRAVLYVGRTATPERPTQTEEISRALGVPRNYLSKILHGLTRRGILRSTRGPAGGFTLAEDAHALPLVRIVEPFDTVEARRTCLLGRPECSDSNPCPAHSRWKAVGDQVRGFFWNTTVADLLGEGGALR